MSMGSWSGKVVLVTGASSGIGRATAVRLGQEGASIIVAARREAQGAETVEAVEAAGGQARFVSVDIADEASVEALFGFIDREFRRLDGAFNNAGVWLRKMPFQDTPVDEFDAVFRVNVRGTWLCMRHEIRIMGNQGHGAIVNNASILGLIGSPQSSIYASGKAAIISMTKCAALELAEQGIRVNCLCPGGVRTDMTGPFAAQVLGGEEAMARRIPMKRIGTVEELAEAAMWLLSPAASYMTGSVMIVDGGLSVG